MHSSPDGSEELDYVPDHTTTALESIVEQERIECLQLRSDATSREAAGRPGLIPTEHRHVVGADSDMVRHVRRPGPRCTLSGVWQVRNAQHERAGPAVQKDTVPRCVRVLLVTENGRIGQAKGARPCGRIVEVDHARTAGKRLSWAGGGATPSPTASASKCGSSGTVIVGASAPGAGLAVIAIALGRTSAYFP